jgi:predicted phage terminase large subunit-like protein
VTLAPDLDAAFLARFAEAVNPAPKPRRWATPLDLAQELNPAIVRTPALEVINKALVDVADGRNDRLMIFMSPQEAKSTTVSHRFVQWSLLNDPGTRAAIVSYADEIARRWGSDIKQDVATYNGDDGGIDLGLRLRADSKAAGRWQIDGHPGGVYCVGVAGSLTGRPVDLLVLDDVHKDLEQAQSATYRERAVRFWQAVAVPRLGPGAKCVLVMTRWHEADLAGYLLEHEGDVKDGGRWRVLSIPAQCEDEATDPLGRREGEYMISARGNRDWEAIKKSVGSYVWASLYQQRPAPAEGGLFKRLWWRYHTISGNTVHLGGRDLDLRDCWRFATVDLAASTRTSADFTVIAAWARTVAGDLVLLDLVRARIGEDQHFAQARPLVQRWNLDTVFVEASQYGTTLVREATQDNVPITPIQAESDKFSRALPYSAWVSSGRVWLPGNNPHWLDAFLTEHASFPAAAHDDTVDTGSLAVRVSVTKWAPPPTPRTPAGSFGDVDLMTAPM